MNIPFSSSFHGYGLAVSRHRSTEPQDVHSQASWLLVHIPDHLRGTQAHTYHRHFHSFHVSCSFHLVSVTSDIQIQPEPMEQTWQTFPLFYARKRMKIVSRADLYTNESDERCLKPDLSRHSSSYQWGKYTGDTEEVGGWTRKNGEKGRYRCTHMYAYDIHRI